MSERIRELLERVRNGQTSVEEALAWLQDLPYENLGFARLDHHRALRKGFPEVVFGEGKTPGQVAQIMVRLARTGRVLATRVGEEHYRETCRFLPEATYHPVARAITVGTFPQPEREEYGVVISAGTADIPVAEEAALTARFAGSRIETLYDVGVAGLHRLLDHRELLFGARVIVVVAGMEGALASVVGGLVRCPVIGVPTQVGYGAAFGGLSALLTMLTSCAPGVAVVNIDNGFGAGYLAHLILDPGSS